MQLALDKFPAMDTSTGAPRSARGFGVFLRAEFPLFIGLASAAIFLALGSGAVENVDHPLALAGGFCLVFFGLVCARGFGVRPGEWLGVEGCVRFGATSP